MNIFVVLIVTLTFMILAFAIIAIAQKKKANTIVDTQDITETSDDAQKLHIFYRLLQQQADDIHTIKVCILFFVILTALSLVVTAIAFMLMNI